jgi:tryptophan synthase alpha chain
MNALEQIQRTFDLARAEGRAALMPYFTIGYPDLQTSFEIVCAIAESGADLIELGIPFSDPLADGPTIQYSTQVALQNGVNIHTCLDFVKNLREQGLTTPIFFMGYYNPIFNYGEERFAKAVSECGGQGLIVPDLPPEEAGELRRNCRNHQVAMVHLIAPTTPPERRQQIAELSEGFLYVVSVTGVTGARKALPPDLMDFLREVRAGTKIPLAVGFGVSTPEQAASLGQIVDGVIVGSALIEIVRRAEQPLRAVRTFIRELQTAMRRNIAG